MLTNILLGLKGKTITDSRIIGSQVFLTLKSGEKVNFTFNPNAPCSYTTNNLPKENPKLKVLKEHAQKMLTTHQSKKKVSDKKKDLHKEGKDV